MTKSKLSKIKSVDYYLQIKKLDVAFCIDAIIVNDDSIEILEKYYYVERPKVKVMKHLWFYYILFVVQKNYNLF